MDPIPDTEIEATRRLMAAHPGYFEVAHVIRAYEKLGLRVIPHGFSPEVAALVREALVAEAPFSVVRVGDGEANFLAYGVYGTPALDRHAVAAMMAMQQDHFAADETWALVLRELLLGALAQADVVGVTGVWRVPPQSTMEGMLRNLPEHPRGVSGSWRSIDLMLRLARCGGLRGKVVAAIHLYFAVISHLADLVAVARKTWVISTQEGIVEKLRARHPGKEFGFIRVGAGGEADRPGFLTDVHAALPADLRGELFLIGAGPWAEIYCSWVKQRGGVGVDVGSGLDLLDGKISRPFHRKLGVELMESLRL